ncbi:MAG: small basic protein [Phycisphaerae bacterium]|nr:small basic protein [Phycisphaerae bacterium]
MSLDRSLKSANSLVRHRNVLSRAERIEKLADEERWESTQSVFGLPKVSHRKTAAAHKDKKEEKGEEAAASEGVKTEGEGAKKKP